MDNNAGYDWNSLDDIYSGEKKVPDATSQSFQALEEKYARPDEDATEYQPLYLSSIKSSKDTPITAKFLAQRSLAGLSGLTNALSSSLADAVVGPIKDAIQISQGNLVHPVNFDLTNKLADMGIINKNNLNPTGILPKLVGAGVEGLSGQLPLALLSEGTTSIPGLTKLAAQGIGSGVGGELGNELGGTAGNIAGSVLGGASPNALEAIGAKLNGIPASFLSSSPLEVNPQAAGPLLDLMKRSEIGAGVEPSINQFFPNMKRSLTQQQQINSSFAKTFGQNSTDLKPDVFDKASKEMGQEFDAIAQKAGDIPLDENYSINHQAIQNRVNEDALSDYEKNALQKMLDKIAPQNNIKEDELIPSITGQNYQQLTQKGSQLSNLQGNGNPAVQQIAQAIRGNLDEALGNALSPEDLKDYKNLRTRYKNYLMVQDFKPDSMGNIDPGAVTTNRISNYYPNYNKGDLAGQDAMEDLLRGMQFLKIPESGPASSPNKLSNLLKIGAGAGAAAMAEPYGMELLQNHPTATLSAIAGGAGLLGTKAISKQVLDSQWYKNQLLKQALDQTPTYNPLISSTLSLMANQK